jgi:hypothetical protein
MRLQDKLSCLCSAAFSQNNSVNFRRCLELAPYRSHCNEPQGLTARSDLRHTSLLWPPSLCPIIRREGASNIARSSSGSDRTAWAFGTSSAALHLHLSMARRGAAGGFVQLVLSNCGVEFFSHDVARRRCKCSNAQIQIDPFPRRIHSHLTLARLH